MTTENTEARPDRDERPRGRDRDDRDRGDRGDRGDRDERPRRGGLRRRGCEFCIDKINVVDYKDLDLLRRYVGDRGKIEPRRKVGVCSKHQRIVAQAIKRARHVALLPYTAEHIRQTGVLASRR
ncbi:MAG: 30S ribosomal protein S18 [Dehalococcoidia bacterium]